MTTLSVEAVQVQLNKLIDRLAPGEELVITRDSQPVDRLLAASEPAPITTTESESKDERRPIFGRGRGDLTIVSEDDDHLEDFAEYME